MGYGGKQLVEFSIYINAEFSRIDQKHVRFRNVVFV